MQEIANYFAKTFSNREEDQKLLEKLFKAAQEGMPFIEWHDASNFSQKLLEGDRSPVCFQAPHRYYLRRYYEAEMSVKKHIQRLLEDRPRHTFKSKNLILEGLNEEQKRAVHCFLEKGLMILTGGPGTGKTFTAVKMLETLIDQIKEKEPLTIAVTAPTGKAAQHLGHNLQRAFKDRQGYPFVEGVTLHSLLLGLDEHLHYDVVVVDEASMIDLELFAKLLSSIKPHARLLLIGDQKQLPPVEAGIVFKDIVESLNTHSVLVELKTCLRIENQTLYSLASSLREGDKKAFFQALKSVDFRSLQSIGSDLFQVGGSVVDFFFKKVGLKCDMEALNRFRILTPYKKGLLGTEALNISIQKALTSNFLPIIVLQNDATVQLMNGDMALLDRKEHVALFDHLKNPLPQVLLPEVAPAFALSVHKSQGSEFDEVLILIPEGADIFGIEMLYTAVTRAKKGVHIWADERTLEKFFDEL